LGAGLACLLGCSLHPQGGITGPPLPFATVGAEASNACGLLSLGEVAGALGNRQLGQPETGGDTLPPTCTWFALSGDATVSAEVSSDPIDVHAARSQLSPPYPRDEMLVPGLGGPAVIEASTDEVTVLLHGGQLVLLVWLHAAEGTNAAHLCAVESLAKLAVSRLGARRPAAPSGQLLV
jgi:hypothetical protein